MKSLDKRQIILSRSRNLSTNVKVVTMRGVTLDPEIQRRERRTRGLFDRLHPCVLVTEPLIPIQNKR